MPGADTTTPGYIELIKNRSRWIRSMVSAMKEIDAFLSPTVPCVAPTIQSVSLNLENKLEFFKLNSLSY